MIFLKRAYTAPMSDFISHNKPPPLKGAPPFEQAPMLHVKIDNQAPGGVLR